MTNAEFHKDKIKKLEGKSFCDDFIKPMLWNGDCFGIDCDYCHVYLMMWLLEEHKEPEVDWASVPIDTPILVRNYDDTDWAKRHFAGVINEGVLAWINGRTSHTETTTTLCVHAKLWEGSEEQAEEQRKREAAE